MSTLYVENLPEDLYEALRTQAREHGKSISAEVISLLRENIPTPDELARRRSLLQCARRLSARRPGSTWRFPTAEEMQRKDRLR